MENTNEQWYIAPRDKNADAIAWTEKWYSTPDAQPPGYWDDLLREIESGELRFRLRADDEEV